MKIHFVNDHFTEPDDYHRAIVITIGRYEFSISLWYITPVR